MNIDVVGSENDTWGIIIVVRDGESVVLFVCNLESYYSSWLRCGWDFGIQTNASICFGFGVSVHYDWNSLLIVVRAINGSFLNNSYMFSIIVDCRNLLSLFPLHVVAHVKRTINTFAHNLVKFCLISWDNIWVENCSPCIFTFTATDLVD